MSSTLWQAEHLAPVIRLVDRGVGDTLMVRVGLVSDEVIYRWVGINDSTTIGECCRVVAAVFGIDGEVASNEASLSELRDVLPRTGTSTHFSWGLWSFEMQLADVYPRDESTPPSVCVAGSGAFGDIPFDLAKVNRRLIGQQEDWSSAVRPELVELARRASHHDFYPLVQALDLQGPTLIDDSLSNLPVETHPKARDAFWSLVIAAMCCFDEPETAHIAEGIMASLGWEGTGVREMRELAQRSLTLLGAIAGPRTPAHMLEVYRGLIRRG